MKKVALSKVKDNLSRYLRIAEKHELVITRHGKPAGILVGFASDDDWFDYQLENDPRFLQRIERARQACAAAAESGWKTCPTPRAAAPGAIDSETFCTTYHLRPKRFSRSKSIDSGDVI